MKKLVSICFISACAVLSAQEKAADNQAASTPVVSQVSEKAPWPVWVAFNSTKNIDVVGMRLTIPYGSCESVTGFDLGVFGRCRYFEGLQVNFLRNEVEDVFNGLQVGIFNSAGAAASGGIQIGLWNEANGFRGVQVGLINMVDSGEGLQIGIVNRAESFYGFQAGGVCAIREAEYACLPLINIGFDTFTDPKL